MLTRRQVLLGAGAGVAVVEGDDPRVRRALHRFGVVDSPDWRSVARQVATIADALRPGPDATRPVVRPGPTRETRRTTCSAAG